MNKVRFLLLIITIPLHATVVVPPQFVQTISTKVFDRATGTFFVGLSASQSPYTLSAANRANFGNNSEFRGIAIRPPLNENDGIEYLTLATSKGNTNPTLGIVIQLPTGSQQANVVVASNASGTQVTRSGLLNDASGATNVNGLRTSGIVGLAASQFFMFPAVKPCGGNFGADCNGGIASVAINQSTLILNQVPAIPGDGGIKAQILDPTTPAVLINNSPTIVPNTVDLHWDDQLQRLYIGLQMTTAGLSDIGITCATGTGNCDTAPLPSCPTGLFLDTATLNCITCPSGGFYNTNNMTCQFCPSGSLFSTTSYTCVTATCPTGQFFNPSTDVLACVTCPSGFFFDQGLLTCVTCGNSQYYDPNVPGCVACPSGYVFDPNAGTCINGPISCPSGQQYYQGICITPPSCPDGFTAVGLTCVSGAGEPFPPQPQFVGDPSILSPALWNNRFLTIPFAGPNGISQPLPTRTVQMATRQVASGARSVVVGQVDSSGQITLNDIAPDSAFAIGNTQNIVGILDTVPRNLAINKVRVLHASTGPSYLIVNGVSNGDISAVGGNIYALPLVDLDDPANPLQGTLADVDSALVNYKFVTPAMANNEMPVDNESAVVVGVTPLALPSGGLISDIDVVGDTVYVSINAMPSSSTEGGILYSQALFDETGKIINWTPWTKKAFPPYGSTNASGISMFAVDALTSKVWGINSDSSTVYQTAWTNVKSTVSAPNSSLVGQINANLNGAATAILDLDQATPGFLSNTSRYALFSGDFDGTTQVIFARISQSLGNLITSPQTVVNDFTLASNFLVTELSPGCQVQALEYARQQTGAPANYFFAGTQNGLYVFSDSGNGFDVSTMGSLNAPPFSNGSWTLAPNITGSVVDIKTSGNTLYVVVQNAATSATHPMQSTVYRIPFQTTVATMFASGNIFTLAQTGIGIFANIYTFNAVEIIATNTTGSTEQIVLATNNGLYQSTLAGGVQVATTQTDAGWQIIADTLFFYNGIASIDNAAVPFAPSTTLWPFHIGDFNNLNTDNGSVLQQLNGNTDAGPYEFIPALFDSIDAATNPTFTTLPLFSYFWSDGARRIATVDNISSSCAPEDLLSFPYDTIMWNLTNIDQALIDDPILNKAIAYYWVKQIGVSGLLMTGTNNGVIALG